MAQSKELTRLVALAELGEKVLALTGGRVGVRRRRRRRRRNSKRAQRSSKRTVKMRRTRKAAVVSEA